MQHLVSPVLPIFLFVICMIGLAFGLLGFARLVRPGRPGRVTRMTYESGMDPIHDTRRRFDVRFYLLAIAFLVFDVELLFLYPWAVAAGEARNAQGTSNTELPPAKIARGRVAAADKSSSPSLPLSQSPPLAKNASATLSNRHLVFAGVMIFLALLTLGFIYDWRKGVFQWR